MLLRKIVVVFTTLIYVLKCVGYKVINIVICLMLNKYIVCKENATYAYVNG